MKFLYTLYVSLAICHAQSSSRNSLPLPDSVSNLPQQKIGVDDLVGISVYDAPELTRTLRVSGDGSLSLPMVKRRIPVAGLLPGEVEAAIVRALREEEILVSPVVTVSVIEYRSRPISIVGAVKKPTSFQVSGAMNLLEALSRAEGLSEDAGSEILLTSTKTDGRGQSMILTSRIPVKALIDAANPDLNVALQGGEEIRVPPAGKVFVVGNVKKPGSFPIRDSSESTILKALALSEGLMPYASETAYIYRMEDSKSEKTEIAVDLRKIMKRQSADVALRANDILYIPDRTGKRAAITSLERMLSIGTGLGTAAILVAR